MDYIKRGIRYAFLITTLICSFFGTSFSQESDKIKYQASGVYFMFQDPETKKVLSKVPAGRDVILVYDTFFKKWEVMWTAENGALEMSTFHYVMDAESSTKVMDNHGATFYLFNYLAEKKKLAFAMENLVNDLLCIIVVEGVSRE